ncbi:MAG TPA: hypothetical protein QKA14_01435 [Candidatus Megaira endosymbiont of Hartmannula sinica]|nr:hypothetical protein [Candidatus Megaera endosymbiont of Hartmannula sinica]
MKRPLEILNKNNISCKGNKLANLSTAKNAKNTKKIKDNSDKFSNLVFDDLTKVNNGNSNNINTHTTKEKLDNIENDQEIKINKSLEIKEHLLEREGLESGDFIDDSQNNTLVNNTNIYYDFNNEEQEINSEIIIETENNEDSKKNIDNSNIIIFNYVENPIEEISLNEEIDQYHDKHENNVIGDKNYINNASDNNLVGDIELEKTNNDHISSIDNISDFNNKHLEYKKNNQTDQDELINYKKTEVFDKDIVNNNTKTNNQDILTTKQETILTEYNNVNGELVGFYTEEKQGPAPQNINNIDITNGVDGEKTKQISKIIKQISNSYNIAKDNNMNKIIINLTPKTLGKIEIIIDISKESFTTPKNNNIENMHVNNSKVTKVNNIAIISENKNTIKLINDNKSDLVGSFNTNNSLTKDNLNDIKSFIQDNSTNLDGNKDNKENQNSSYFNSAEERKEFMENFASLYQENNNNQPDKDDNKTANSGYINDIEELNKSINNPAIGISYITTLYKINILA